MDGKGAGVRASVRELLFTDFDGDPVDDPDRVVLDGLDDPRHTDRIEPLHRLLDDPATEPYDRFLACYALASWGDRDGYRGVADAATQSSEVVWYEALLDVRYSVDETFAQLATAVSQGVDLAREKQTEPDRLAALRALVRIADSQYFDWRLAFALDQQSLMHVADTIRDTVRRGVQRLSDGPRPAFDLPWQLAGLIAALTTVDEEGAVGLGMDLAARDSSPRTIIGLAAVVDRGQTPISQTFGEYLGTIGGEESRAEVKAALARRSG